MHKSGIFMILAVVVGLPLALDLRYGFLRPKSEPKATEWDGRESEKVADWPGREAFRQRMRAIAEKPIVIRDTPPSRSTVLRERLTEMWSREKYKEPYAQQTDELPHTDTSGGETLKLPRVKLFPVPPDDEKPGDRPSQDDGSSLE